MPIDPRIALGVQQSTFDPAAAMQNALAIRNAQQTNQLNQMKLAAEQQAAQETAGLQNYLTSANLSTPEGMSGLLKYGIPGATVAKTIAERQAAEALTTQRGAEAEKFKTETKAKASETAINKANSYKDMLNFVRNPQDYAKWVQMQRNDPDLVGTPVHDISDEDLQRNLAMIPTDQAGFDAFKGKAWMGIDKWTTSQQQAATAAETKRHNLELEKAAQERIASIGLNAKDYPNVAQAIADGLLSPDRVNSRNVSILESAARVAQEKGQSLDFNQLAGQGALARNPAFQQKAMAVESIPEVISKVAEAGKKLNFSDNLKAVADIQKWYAGQIQDPKLTEYMTLRNDSLMSIAYAMRQAGMSDYATRMEAEAASPSMSPKQLDAWVSAQMKALEPRLKQYRSISVTGSKTSTPPAAGGGAQTPTKSLDDIFKKKTP